MKKFLILCTIGLLSACASKPTTQNTAQSQPDSSLDFEPAYQPMEEVALADDAHSKDIYAILRAIKVLDLVKLGFEAGFKEQIEIDPDKTEYFTCAINKISENGLLNLMTPIYKKHVNAEQAQKIAQILFTPTGKKFAQMTRVIAGHNEEMPQMSPKEITTMTPYLKDFKLLGSTELQQELEGVGESYGMQLGFSCAHALINK